MGDAFAPGAVETVHAVSWKDAVEILERIGHPDAGRIRNRPSTTRPTMAHSLADKERQKYWPMTRKAGLSELRQS